MIVPFHLVGGGAVGGRAGHEGGRVQPPLLPHKVGHHHQPADVRSAGGVDELPLDD